MLIKPQRYWIALVIVLTVLLGWLLAQAEQASNQGADGLYHNRYIEFANGGNFFKWQWQRLTTPNRRAPEQAIQAVAPDLDTIFSPSDSVRATWIGHSTLLYQIDGINILTDPQWSERASPVSFAGPKRHQPAGVDIQDLPRIDYVLISHNHYDHLDLDTVQSLMNRPNQQTKFLVPAGVEKWFHENVTKVLLNGQAKNVIAFNWWQDIGIQGKTASHQIRFLPVQHWSARGLFDRYETLWGSWAVLSPHFTFWFSGDLGYSQDIQDIQQNIGDVDLAAIAIGGYAPRWFMQAAHIDPFEAVKVMQDLHAKKALAIHWGTFSLTDEPLDEPPRLLHQAMQQQGLDLQRFKVLKHGETWVLN